MGAFGLFQPSMSTAWCRRGCDGHRSLASPWALVTRGRLCSLPQVIEAMERVLQEKLAGVGRSPEKPAGGCKWGQGPSYSCWALLVAISF